MPRRQAREIFDAFVAGHPRRVAALLEEVGNRGGPVERLDFTRASLTPLWIWFLEARDPLAGRSRPERRIAEPATEAWWAPYHPTWYRELGDALAVIATMISAYFFECIRRARPGAEWVFGRHSENRNQPVLEIPGRGEMGYAVPLVAVLRALNPQTPPDEAPDGLRRLYDVWLGLDSEYEALARRSAEPLPRFAVQRAERGSFTHLITLADEIAHRGAVCERLLVGLTRSPDVELAVREDREVILVRAPAMTEERLTAIVEGHLPA